MNYPLNSLGDSFPKLQILVVPKQYNKNLYNFKKNNNLKILYT